jgi:hypothetical protein
MEGIRIGQFSLVSNKGKHHYDCYDQNGNITGYPVTQGIAREIEILQIKNEELKSLLKEVKECPHCNNDGCVVTNYSVETGEDYEQCQWCAIKDQLIPPIKKEENTSLDEDLPF